MTPEETLKGKTILIVDDEPDLRSPIVFELESMGCRVFEAGNGKVAFEIIQREKIDAVVSDIRMPGGDGIELLKNIKAMHHEFPMVMLITGFSDLSREDAYDFGAEAILSKPFDLDELDEALAKILTHPRRRWSVPPVPPEPKVQYVEEFTNLAEAQASGDLKVGRGGLFVRQSSAYPRLGEAVAIQIRFKEGEIPEIQGSGRVRWVRRQGSADLPAGYGVEFERLTDTSRESILQFVESLKIRPFIPKV